MTSLHSDNAIACVSIISHVLINAADRDLHERWETFTYAKSRAENDDDAYDQEA